MLQFPRMVSYLVPDLEQAKQWYCGLLGREPSFDSPMLAVFSVGECTLALVAEASVAAGEGRSLVYWDVGDIEAAYQRLLASGATSQAQVALFMPKTPKARTARVVDPFGNVLGLISGAEDRVSVEQRPVDTALSIAFCRALAAHDPLEELRGPDYLAELFLDEDRRQCTANPTAHAWMRKNVVGYSYFMARTAYFDEIVQQALREGVPQVVLLGAGYGTRPYRFHELITSTRFFELDAASIQQHKRQVLRQADIAMPEQLTYVPTNFPQDSLADVLLGAGFDPRQQTLFLWEGGTFYLTPQVVDETLSMIHERAPAGSTICFDFLIDAPDLHSRYGAQEVLDWWRSRFVCEGVQFAVEDGTIDVFLAGRGFRLLEEVTAERMEREYLTLQDGTLGEKVAAIFGFAHAAVAE